MARVDGDTARVLHLLPSMQARRIPPLAMGLAEPYDYAARLRWRNHVLEEKRLDFRFDVQRLVSRNMARRAREMGMPWDNQERA